MPDLVSRRSVVTLVALLSLIGAVTAVRVASAWTASSASFSVKPVDAQVLAQRLADEQSRSAALRTQLDAVAAQAGQLADALKAAQQKAQADAAAAAGLASQLASAKAKLAALESGMTSPGGPASSQSSVSPAPASSTAGSGWEGGGDD